MEEGIVKIGDYGLAKLITPSQETGHSESIGTCHYMAPEIASGKYHKPIDIYAIGVILYEMLTGRVPFEGESVGEILMKHLTARPDLATLPEPYRTIVGRALAKDPAQRPGPGLRTAPTRGRTEAGRSPVHRRRQGRAARHPPSRSARRRISSGSAPRSRSSTSAPKRGPDAAPRPLFKQRLRAGWASLRRPSPTPAPRCAPAPEPPPLPVGRLRVAELASSLLWAAVLTVPLGLAAGTFLGVDVSRGTQQIAYLIVLSLLGAWSVLAANKALEGRTLDSTSRRLLFLTIGLVLGIAGLVLGRWLQVDPLMQGWTAGPSFEKDPRFFYWTAFGKTTLPEWYAAYFGLLFLVNGGWGSLAARDRKARFRALPVLGTGLIAALLYGFLPFSDPSEIAVATLIAIVTQLVSPWSEAAAAYARTKRNRRVA